MTSNAKTVAVGDVAIGLERRIAVICGPCAIEGRDHALFMAERLAAIFRARATPLIYKSSFDKANRSSAASARGIGLEEGLRVLEAVKDATGLPVLTDVHQPEQCAPVADVVDVLQIPAFLCRQTDLLAAAAATQKTVNVKKGQFLAPWDMANVAAKLETFDARGVLLTERGASFGYNALVSDMRALPVMAATGWPVIFDATHSVQQPGGRGTTSGGERRHVETLARAAVAVGVAGLFVECHQDPDNAPSDGPNMVPLDALPALLDDLVAFDDLAKSRPARRLERE